MKQESMICGVDEAGKGSVLGPMVVAAVGCREIEDIAALPVRDSKAPARAPLTFPVGAFAPFVEFVRASVDAG